MSHNFYDLVSYLCVALFTLAVTFATFVVLYVHHVHSKWAHMPGPPRDSFFLGNMPSIKKMRKEKGFFLALMLEEWYQKYGQTYVIYVLHKPLIFTLDPEGIKELLITGGHGKPKDWKLIGFLYGERFLGRGLVTEPDSEHWAKRRTILNPAFHRKFLRGIISEFNAVGDELVTKLTKLADGKTVVDLERELHRATLDVIGKVAFDKNLDSLNEDENPFPKAISRALEGFTKKVQDPFSSVKFWEDRAFKQSVRESCRILRESGKEWLAERREAMARGEDVPEDTLTLIVKAQDKHPDVMDMDTVIDDIVTFFAAGQETTANSLSFSLLEIGRREDVRKRVSEEINRVMGDRRYVEFEDVNKMEYASYVMKESLRMYPPASIQFREAARDTSISGYKVYKGSRIVMSSLVCGRSEEFHKDPLVFNPDRFKPTCEFRPSMYSYFPFSLGERNCIGQNFAQIEGKLFMVKILQHFDIEISPDYVLELKESLTLRPKHGVKCTLTLRE